MKRLSFIDSLRGLAILGVLLVHCGQEGSSEDLPPAFKAVTEAGSQGVVLFFIVSAFTIFLSLENQKKQRYKRYTFYFKRFLRIAPLYYLGICFFTFIGYEGKLRFKSPEFFLNLTLTNSLSPNFINSLVPGGWSISVEFLFYFLAPLLFLLIRSIYHCLAFVLLALIIRFLLVTYFSGALAGDIDPLFTYYFLPNHLFVFGMGFLLYFLVKDEKPNLVYQLVLLFSILAGSVFLNRFMPLLFPLHYFFSIVFVIGALYLSTGRGVIINNRPLQYLGKISYSMYLVHFIVLLYMQRYNFNDIVDDYSLKGLLLNLSYRYSMLLVITVFVSYFSYKFIEVPFQNLGKKLVYTLGQKDILVTEINKSNSLI
jgi:peptidoglycan/LPS O-acetylase OafA/YrhL